MKTPPLPADEPERLAELQELDVLDAATDPQLQSIAELAATILQVPISLVSLVDADRQLFTAKVGLDANETCRDYAFCAYAILQGEPLIVENALEDPRFSGNPLVTSAPHIRFYAGAPLTTTSGYRLGTLCVIDTKPRRLDAGQVAMLKMLASLAVDIMQTRRRLERAEIAAARQLEVSGSPGLQLSVLGHEMRTPLTHILGFADLLKANLTGGGEGGSKLDRNVEYLDIIRQSGSHLVALLDKVVDLERAGSEAALRLDRVDLNEVLEQVTRSFEGTVSAKGQGIVFRPTEHPAVALADLTSLRQIAINLISNASKYSPAGAAIEVAIEADAGEPWCCVVVEDNGPGISQAVLDRIGEPFLRGAAARSEQQGSGLGLYVTLRLCAAMTASLQVERRESGGTRATLRLQAANRQRSCEPRLVVG